MAIKVILTDAGIQALINKQRMVPMLWFFQVFNSERANTPLLRIRPLYGSLLRLLTQLKGETLETT